MALDDLYQDILLDHYRHPRHGGTVADAEVRAEERNPSCGDHVRLYVRLGDDGRIADVRHESHGCAISTASASMMCEFALGKTPDEFRAEAEGLIAHLRGEREALPDGGPEELEALAGVRQFSMRVKCATMCWHALLGAVQNEQ
jgi:nitrogen fixation protein NifU and related proteins